MQMPNINFDCLFSLSSSVRISPWRRCCIRNNAKNIPLRHQQCYLYRVHLAIGYCPVEKRRLYLTMMAAASNNQNIEMYLALDSIPKYSRLCQIVEYLLHLPLLCAFQSKQMTLCALRSFHLFRTNTQHSSASHRIRYMSHIGMGEKERGNKR